MNKSHAAGWDQNSPTPAQLKELFFQIASGRIGRSDIQGLLNKKKTEWRKAHDEEVPTCGACIFFSQKYSPPNSPEGICEYSKLPACLGVRLLRTEEDCAYDCPCFEWRKKRSKNKSTSLRLLDDPFSDGARFTVFELVESAGFRQILGSDVGILDSLCLTEDQVQYFLKNYSFSLKWGNFYFLIKNNKLYGGYRIVAYYHDNFSSDQLSAIRLSLDEPHLLIPANTKHFFVFSKVT